MVKDGKISGYLKDFDEIRIMFTYFHIILILLNFLIISWGGGECLKISDTTEVHLN